MNLTTNKLSIAQLLATPNEQFCVPSYQRRYAWKWQQYLALFEDIDMLKENDGHLFGMIILHTSFHTGGLNKPELVDGQQRMTTLIILLKALETVYRRKKKTEKADEIKKMIFCKGLDDVQRPKIELGDLDNDDIVLLLNNGDEQKITNLKISDAYYDFCERLDDMEPDEMNKFFFKLTNIAVIIRLDVGMAQDAYKLFETINNRGLKLTPTDIIKNFLLGHAAKIQEDNTLERVKKLWSSIIINLDGIDSDDFLRQFMCSILHRKITMSTLEYYFKDYYIDNVDKTELLGEYEYYKDDEETEDDENESETEENLDLKQEVRKAPKEKKEPKYTIITFLEYLEALSKIYKSLCFAKSDNIKIDRHLSNLNKILSKPSYIFLMHFFNSKKYSEKEVISILKLMETLMLRRHICERRTSENDDIFAKMVPLIESEDLKSAILEYLNEGEDMPSDNEFEENFPKHQFKGRLIDRAKYVLETIEYYIRGNTSELVVSSGEEVHLEHIIPQTINTKKSIQEFGDWQTYLGDRSVVKHKKYVNYIGNMTLLGESLNIQAYNNPFAKKKNSYRKSNFKITQELADKNDFKFINVDKRSEQLTALALKIWNV